MELLEVGRIELDNEYGARVEIYKSKDIYEKDCFIMELIITNNILPIPFYEIETLNAYLKSLGFKETIEKPFDLVEFLKENFTKVDFTPWNDNLFIYYDYNRKELLIQEESIDDNIGTVYLKFNDIVTPSRINSVISKLNESKVVPHQLKQAYKELGWL